MDAFDNRLIKQAADLDRELGEVLGSPGIGPKPTNWGEILANNNIDYGGIAVVSTQDHVISCLIGVVGGVLDLTKAYEGGLTDEGTHQRYDELSKDYLHRVTGLDGMAAIDNQRGGGAAHRVIGPAHDLARFFEAIGQIVNGKFSSNFGAVEKIVTRYSPKSAEYLKIDNPVDAAIILILHLIGDFFSSQSLPIPGRTLMAETDQVEVYRMVVREFREGGNLREQVSTFLSNLSGTILISIFLRLYRYYQLFVVERQAIEIKRFKLGDDEPYHLMLRDAQCIAFVISAGKAVFTANPMDVNYTSFIQFVRSATAINRLSKQELERLDAEFAQINERIEAI